MYILWLSGTQTPTAKGIKMTAKQIAKKLQNAGFDMDAVVEINRNEIVIGYVTSDVVDLADRDRTEAAMNMASEILGWSGHSSQWGGWHLSASYKVDETDCNSVYSKMHY